MYNYGVPVQVVDHGATRQAAGDAGTSQGHGGGRFAQVVPDGSQAVHVTTTGAEAAGQTTHTPLTDAGVVPCVSHRRGVLKETMRCGDQDNCVQCLINGEMQHS